MTDPTEGVLALDDLDLDLDLGELTVTALRDSVALPETGASGGVSSSSCGSSSCAQPRLPELPY
ncbi:thiazolylpeptide-type bacteriocin [Streptomyces globosus]|uniref:Thiazolylpeptide-type bacteriocin n=1 Tax=Streptomyces globosus TaxID=68209 RepID=A0A344U200_9ACTN|nr:MULTISPECIES: thiazolylpeptide-type bacteriocin [Streptomyces]AXE24921.1 thiazolylpeptide-type bacteriocin [Streptomyces globosus]